PLLDLNDVMDLVHGGSAAAKAVAAGVLGRRPGAATELGLERVVALAQHPLVAVRAAAHALAAAAAAELGRDPSLLFLLVESDWDDTRRAALDLLKTRLGPHALGKDHIVALCDSTRPEVQDLGKELVRREMTANAESTDELLTKLVEHPHANMRRFALEL